MLAWRNDGTHRRRKGYYSGTYRRDERCPRIFIATGGLVTRKRDWVRGIVSISLWSRLLIVLVP